MRNTFQIFIFIFINILIAHPMMSQEYRSAKDAKGLEPGVQAPLFNAKDMHENDFSLQQALDQGPVVMIFYRGHWCPVCNKHLKTLQDSLDVIKQYGATLIAVSPERVSFLGKTEEKTGVEFTLLFDEDYQIARAFDVHFRPGTTERVMYNTMLGAKLKVAHSDDSQQLPIPATYVIDSSGTIVWRHFDPDYRKRSSVEDIVNALERLSE
jgi:peroxiredoxin